LSTSPKNILKLHRLSVKFTLVISGCYHCHLHCACPPLTSGGLAFTAVATLAQLGFAANDLDGTYFTGGESGVGNFSWVINDDEPLDFLITASAPAEISTPSKVTLDHAGNWVETP